MVCEIKKQGHPSPDGLFLGHSAIETRWPFFFEEVL